MADFAVQGDGGQALLGQTSRYCSVAGNQVAPKGLEHDCVVLLVVRDEVQGGEYLSCMNRATDKFFKTAGPCACQAYGSGTFTILNASASLLRPC